MRAWHSMVGIKAAIIALILREDLLTLLGILRVRQQSAVVRILELFERVFKALDRRFRFGRCRRRYRASVTHGSELEEVWPYLLEGLDHAVALFVLRQ